jgi:predicted dehydrogenase
MIRVGVAGLRRGASFATLFDAQAEATLVALCDSDTTALARAAARWPHATPCATYEELLAQGLDLVVVATAVADHAAQAVLALDTGVHVLSEVPAASSLAECEQLIAAVERSGRLYMMAENVCYFPAIQTLKSLVEGGRLGRVVYAESDYWNNVRPPTTPGMGRPWRYTLPPIIYCTHNTGPLCYALGDRFVEVTAYGSGAQLDPAAPSA